MGLLAILSTFFAGSLAVFLAGLLLIASGVPEMLAKIPWRLPSP
jgi:hypothetical protein